MTAHDVLRRQEDNAWERAASALRAALARMVHLEEHVAARNRCSAVASSSHVQEALAAVDQQLAALRCLERFADDLGPEIVPGGEPLVVMRHRDAAIAILTRAGAPLAPRHVHAELRAAGRRVSVNTVQQILHRLVGEGALRRLTRGRYALPALPAEQEEAFP